MMKGRMVDERRFKVSGEGRNAPALEGEWSGAAAVEKLVWSEGRKTTPLVTSALAPSGKHEGAVDTGLRGAIGKSAVRAQLKREGQRLTGYYRYARSRDDLTLAGTVEAQSGRFDLVETLGGKTTGRMRGVFLDDTHLAGDWESPDGARTQPMWLTFARPLPQVLTLAGGVKIIPRHEERTIRPSCTEEKNYPEFDGLADRKAQAALNQQLVPEQPVAGDGTRTTDAQRCEGAEADRPYWFNADYTVTSTKHAGLVGLSLGGDEYTGGAHGIGVSTCSVVELATGKLVSLHTLLTPGAREALSRLATEKLRKEHGVTDLTEANFFESEIKAGDRPDLCLYDDHVTLHFGSYEVAPYVMGHPEVSLTFAEVRPLVQKTPLTEAALR
ncbi:MAG: DUF3298/DUF4163 domain-containing protein [Myxococcales bacterium]|nr:MAG: DUF3298/DUF4163 domain-containing protein [Myxococcales bacterium]